MGDQAGSSRRDAGDDILERLARLQLTLTDLLGAVDDDAQRMDANLEDAHRLVEEIRGCAKQEVFRSHGPTNSSVRQRDYKEFEKARVAENDAYEIYSDDLER